MYRKIRTRVLQVAGVNSGGNRKKNSRRWRKSSAFGSKIARRRALAARLLCDSKECETEEVAGAQKLDEKKAVGVSFLGQHNRREENVQDPSEMSWNTAEQVVAGRDELVAGFEYFVGC